MSNTRSLLTTVFTLILACLLATGVLQLQMSPWESLDCLKKLSRNRLQWPHDDGDHEITELSVHDNQSLSDYNSVQPSLENFVSR